MPLDPGWAAIFGGILGAVTTVVTGVVTPLLTSWIIGRKARALSDKRRTMLRGMLNGERYVWRSIDKLAASIGADEPITTALLLDIDARASLTNRQSWALVSRAPWPEDVQPKD